MQSNQALLTTVAKSVDTEDLLNHIAWTEIIRPALLKRRNDLSTLLMQAVLGAPIANAAAQPFTKEQLAGMLYGIDEIIRLFERILKDGSRALETLESAGVHIQQQS